MRTPSTPDLGRGPQTTTDTAMTDAWRAVLSLHGDDIEDWDETAPGPLVEAVEVATSEIDDLPPHRREDGEGTDQGR
jgi:hypothetical protein